MSAFSTAGMMPHGHCYLWDPGLVRLHVASDVLIAGAYLSIPFTLAYFVRRRRDLPFPWIFLCFGLFITACGATHVMEVWTLWHPDYWASGLVKAFTAAVSLTTAVLLVRLMPKALALPSPQDLSESETRFRVLLESAPDAMVLVDGGGAVCDLNSQVERLFGYARGELLGRPVELLMPERFRQGHVAHRAGYFGEPRQRPMGAGMELFGRRKDGSEFPVEISLSPLKTGRGAFALSAVRDISARKETEAALRRSMADADAAYKELETFSYSVAHDLRAPLRKIDAYSQALLDDYGGRFDAQGTDFLQRLRRASQTMAQLIDALLNLARVARAEPRREEVDLGALARSVAEGLREGDPARKVELVVADGVMVQADPRLLKDVMENLLGNAWKFTGRRPRARIEFGVLRGPGPAVYFVRDDGAGFDPAYARRLFSPFERLHRPGEFPGSGIGLATAQRIVQRHGGRMWAEGAVNRGAAFFFTLEPEGER
ncbi:MAG: PAS domain S-box protein [Elusimicrobia bacterium]|nr:PAS domain S-box protein [Elusimicrobiota bacterium]